MVISPLVGFFKDKIVHLFVFCWVVLMFS